ncbi:MAG: hypothetical protein LUQ11_03800 [Methylococcaceae bacterium]|nr:hypothetical protein [Methylococcaceae bacterium]
MSINIKVAIRTVLASAALSMASSGAYAAYAVTVNYHPWDGNDNVVGANETITASNQSHGAVYHGSDAWTDNRGWYNSADGHAVEWNTFQVTAAHQIVTIKDQVTSGQSSRAFTVWASNGPFDGGTLSALEVSSIGPDYFWNAPHSFNAVGQIGSPGTLWMADPSVAIIDPAFSPAVSEGGGNLLKTLAYVNAGNAHASSETGWGETINAGVNRVDTSGGYFDSVTGDYNAGMAELVFTNLSPGWYTVATGGAKSLENSKTMRHALSVSTSAVPLPGAVYLFGSALAGLAASARRQKNLA